MYVTMITEDIVIYTYIHMYTYTYVYICAYKLNVSNFIS